MTQVVTGDAVVLEVSAAAFPVRMVARLLDMLIQLAALGLFSAIFMSAASSMNTAAQVATVAVATVLIIVGYPTIMETLTRGKTVGKLALGLRVVSDDGGPVRFRQALVRALAGIFEIWTILLAPVALVTSMASARGKRLGDMFAGTYVILERVPKRTILAPEFAVVPPPLLAWAAQLELSGLPDQQADAAGSLLRRFHQLEPGARDALAAQLASAIAARVSPPPPPGTPPFAYLAAVLAVRRDRDLARAAGGWPGQPWPGPVPPGTPVLPESSVPPGTPVPPASPAPSPEPPPAGPPPEQVAGPAASPAAAAAISEPEQQPAEPGHVWHPPT